MVADTKLEEAVASSVATMEVFHVYSMGIAVVVEAIDAVLTVMVVVMAVVVKAILRCVDDDFYDSDDDDGNNHDDYDDAQVPYSMGGTRRCR